MAIKSTLIAYVLLFAFLSISFASARILRSEELEGRRNQGRTLFQRGAGSPTDSFVCAYCDPPRGCNGVVNWCPR